MIYFVALLPLLLLLYGSSWGIHLALNLMGHADPVGSDIQMVEVVNISDVHSRIK